ncbi:MAG: DUF3014 domain-containing protein [Gammaproteobacteria bacterium]|uniref:DUF3014 domain-containing protein n=1 Tax=Shewanella hafniensis TaxID=365590 RepID=UPI001BBB7FC2|nr:DUF3014 domain-containing protein [Shewanella hafniensis]MBU1391659.1 DUF3014 domain-containing protein [Gammaproteobacteria bacterium]MBU1476879.1 DUF3014 domain-containing protein [Gammaproteobacteria bacterium]MBU2003362.1 DUF3014 domain-containing protein [Gammaproteobacteria bacterium]MBU2131134.1 DUF3014 domain-containing protein [Gammaproteobacteria bacterium]MBU2189691.1 DUF3014 domain-containing protein [Gammaproteobacteria bacterium]
MQVNQDDRITPQETSSSSNRFALFAIVLVVLLSVGGYYYYSGDSDSPKLIPNAPIVLPETPPSEPMTLESAPEPETTETTPVAPETDTNSPETPAVTEPEVVVEPVPALAESDAFVQRKALAIINNNVLSSSLVQQDLARQFVVFVDNLAQGELTRKVSPLKGPEKLFSVSEITNKVYLNPEGFHRYDAYVDSIAKMDEQTLMATYKQMTPMLEEAFSELGYSNAKFNDRMLQAIKILLAAPIIEDPIELSSISVNYQFVDPNLEALPSAQKLLIRMGPENTRKLKVALRKLESQLAQ